MLGPGGHVYRARYTCRQCSIPYHADDQHAWHGQTTQVMTYSSPPFVFINDNMDGSPPEYRGLAIDLLNLLAVNVGFCYNLTYTPGVRAAGVIDEASNTSTPINLGVGTITITSARYSVWGVVE